MTQENTPDERLWERAKLRLQYAAETRRFEIERFWQRTLFFWTVLGAAFVAYAALAQKDAFAQQTVASFGLIASLAWTLQNRGAKYWQEAWEQKTKRHQRAALDNHLFSYNERRLRKGWFGGWEFSVSRIAIILSDYTVMVWMALLFRPFAVGAREQLAEFGPCSAAVAGWLYDHRMGLLVIGSVVWCGILLFFGRSSQAGGERDHTRPSSA